MARVYSHYWVVLLLLFSSGCRTVGFTRNDVAAPAGISSPKTQISVPKNALPGTAPAQTSSEVQLVSSKSVELVDPPAARVSEQSSVSVPLLATISAALAQNPDLVALRQSERVGVAACGVASTYPFNPFVQVQATPYQHLPGEGPGTTAHYVLLMQRIQLAHQQRHRENAALSSLNGIRWNIHQAELQTVSLTARLYFALLYQRGLLEVAQISQENNEQLLDVLMKRFEAGDASAADVATVRFDTRATQQQKRLVEANYESACRDLLRQLGLPPRSPHDFDGDLTTLQWRLPGAESSDASTDESMFALKELRRENIDWITTWAATRPDVLTARANIDIARANLRLATADRTPDVQVGPYYQRDPDGMSHFGFRAEMNLLFIDTGKPLEAQRAAELGQQTTTWQQLLLRAELEAQTAFERYQLAYVAVEAEFGEDLLELPEELQSLERQFRAGEVDVVRVIQARTSILQNQRARLDLLNELAQSAALLVGATGMPLELLIVP